MARGGRQKNVIPTEKLTLSTTAPVIDHLKRLVATGYFGKNEAQAAEQILREGLRVLMEKPPRVLPKGRRGQ